jgi:hypothetical protein
MTCGRRNGGLPLTSPNLMPLMLAICAHKGQEGNTFGLKAETSNKGRCLKILAHVCGRHVLVSLPWCSQEHAALAGKESLWRFLESNEHMGSRRSGVWGKAELTDPTIGGNPEPSSSLS